MRIFAIAGRSGSRPNSVHLTVQRRITRRYESTKTGQQQSPKTKTTTDAQQTSDTIPGAGWGWIEPLKTPFYAYGKMQHRSPNITQLSSSLVIYFLGDLSAQLVANSGRQSPPNNDDDDDDDKEKKKKDDEEEQRINYEPARGIRALIIGGIFAIPNYRWLLWLGNHFNFASSHALSISTKILINQMVFTPCFNTYFFGMQSLLSGSSLAEAGRRVVDTVPTSWSNSWKVWPAVTAFSFTFIKPQFRSVTAGVVAIGWQTYLSWLNLKAADEEKRKAVEGAGGHGVVDVRIMDKAVEAV